MNLKPISKHLILDRLNFENPWWIHGKIDEDYQLKPRRLYYKLFYSLVFESDVRRAITLMGPRRVGKTVMLHHTIQGLLDNHISDKKICFINIENPVYRNIPLHELFSYARETVADNNPEDWYVFIDEIQYLKDWEIHLKILVDDYPSTKFIVSGSAAAALKLGSTESGAGRFTDFMLPPLTFQEYMHLKKLDHLLIPAELKWGNKIIDSFSALNIKEVNKHFVDYINYGGYPEVIFSDTIKSNPGRYIRSDIVDKVLLKDLPGMYGIQDVQELNSLFTKLAYYSGNEISLESLSKVSGVPKALLKKYLTYLEAAFLIKIVKRIDQNSKSFQRDNFFKVYLTNPSLRTALFSPLSPTDEEMGYMVETAVFSQWMHRDDFIPYYARWSKGEVDLVRLSNKTFKPKWVVEIKWSDNYFENPKKLKSLLNFCEANKLERALSTTVDISGSKIIKGIEIVYIPAAVYCYIVANNTLTEK